MSAITRGLLGKGVAAYFGETLLESFVNLYKELAALVPQEINFEVYQDRLTFACTSTTVGRSGLSTGFRSPLSTGWRGPLKRIAITFIHEFAQSNGMSYLDEWGRSGVGAGVDGRICVGPNPDKEERKEYRRTIRSYRKGHAVHLLERVQKRRYYKRLRQAVERYRPADEYEKD